MAGEFCLKAVGLRGLVPCHIVYLYERLPGTGGHGTGGQVLCPIIEGAIFFVGSRLILAEKSMVLTA